MSNVSVQPDDFKKLQRRLLYLRLGLLVGIFLIFSRLGYLQVIKGSYYRDLSEQNRVRTLNIRPARGLIFDRQGELLAKNVPSLNLYMTLEDIRDHVALAAGFEELIGLLMDEKKRRHARETRFNLPVLSETGI